MNDAPHEPALEHEHTPEAIGTRIAAETAPVYLRDFVFGAIDGCVTTFAIVAGVVGAKQSPALVIILGLANLLADGLSMAIGNFLGTKADQALFNRAKRIEERHVREVPEGEKAEIREIFRRKGFEGELLEHVVNVITSDRTLWVETMLKDEWGLSLTPLSPLKAGLTTFVSFVTVGFVPILPYVLLRGPGVDPPALFALSCVMTGVVFAGIGVLKARVVEEPAWRAALETLFMGGVAATVAYAVGVLLRGLE